MDISPQDLLICLWLLALMSLMVGNFRPLSLAAATKPADATVFGRVKQFCYQLRELLIILCLGGLMATLFAWPVYAFLTGY